MSNLIRRLPAAILYLLFLPACAMAQDSYTYDTIGRLKSITYDNGSSVTYSYDDAGNRTQELIADVPPLTYTLNITHSAGTVFNMKTLADSNGYDCNSSGVGTDCDKDYTINYTVTADIIAAHGKPGGNAIETGTWAATGSLTLHLILNSGVDIIGGGGDAGNGGCSSCKGGAGGNGGHAINMSEDLTITNSGTLKGGSGGGGGGGGYHDQEYGTEGYYGGGGGGGGWPNGTGGSGGSGAWGSGSAGTSATISAGGTRGNGVYGTNGDSGRGGHGGGTTSADGFNGQSGGGSEGGSWGNKGVRGDGIKKNGNTLTYGGSGSYSTIGS